MSNIITLMKVITEKHQMNLMKTVDVETERSGTRNAIWRLNANQIIQVQPTL